MGRPPPCSPPTLVGDKGAAWWVRTRRKRGPSRTCRVKVRALNDKGFHPPGQGFFYFFLLGSPAQWLQHWVFQQEAHRGRAGWQPDSLEKWTRDSGLCILAPKRALDQHCWKSGGDWCGAADCYREWHLETLVWSCLCRDLTEQGLDPVQTLSSSAGESCGTGCMVIMHNKPKCHGLKRPMWFFPIAGLRSPALQWPTHQERLHGEGES